MSWSFWSSWDKGRKSDANSDQRDVLLVVAVFVEHLGEKHAEQVARFRVGVLASTREESLAAQRNHDDHRRNQMQMEQQRDVSAKHRRGNLIGTPLYSAHCSSLRAPNRWAARTRSLRPRSSERRYPGSWRASRDSSAAKPERRKSRGFGTPSRAWCGSRRERGGKESEYVEAFDVRKDLIRGHNEEIFYQQVELVDVRVTERVVVQKHGKQNRYDVVLRCVQ